MYMTEKARKSQNRNNYIRTLRAAYWANMRYHPPSLRFAKHIENELKRLEAKTMADQLSELQGYVKNA